MITIEWTETAFARLEALPEPVAYEIIRRVDLLATFPEFGVSLGKGYRSLENCRQLIVKGSYRAVYEYHAGTSQVHILAVQHCRQRLPTARELRRLRPDAG